MAKRKPRSAFAREVDRLCPRMNPLDWLTSGDEECDRWREKVRLVERAIRAGMRLAKQKGAKRGKA